MRLVCLAALLVAAAGCASAGPPQLSDRFVRQGVPAVDLGGPRPAAAPRRSAAPRAPLTISNVPSRLSSSLSSLEAVEPALRDALFRLRLAPTVAHHVAVAEAYQALGITDTAYDYLQQSLAVNGPSALVYDRLARMWRDWGLPGIGLTYAHKAVFESPDWAAAHNTLGTLLHANGQRSSARGEFERAVAIDPLAAYAWQNLCVVYQAEGRTREAIHACHTARAAGRRRGAGAREPR
ncbi:MAG: tetratricopeptide repeat protein [Vicinamibacterales bacterium]